MDSFDSDNFVSKQIAEHTLSSRLRSTLFHQIRCSDRVKCLIADLEGEPLPGDARVHAQHVPPSPPVESEKNTGIANSGSRSSSERNSSWIRTFFHFDPNDKDHATCILPSEDADYSKPHKSRISIKGNKTESLNNLKRHIRSVFHRRAYREYIELLSSLSETAAAEQVLRKYQKQARRITQFFPKGNLASIYLLMALLIILLP